ncbi:hypothetical protein [Clostridioides difficile]
MCYVVTDTSSSVFFIFLSIDLTFSITVNYFWKDGIANRIGSYVSTK